MERRPARDFASWGRHAYATPRLIVDAKRGEFPVPVVRDGSTDMSWLAFGNGRSYGDSCMNNGAGLIDCRGLDRILDFDPESGVLHAEAGVLLGDIIAHVLPHGWFLPVTPGTKFVTLGGAIANDVHGKNHHVRGTFGRHVEELRLLRSDRAGMVCSKAENAEYFQSTIGGMGLTGIIESATVRLMRVPGGKVDQEIIRFPQLDAFFDLSAEQTDRWEYTVAWIDSLARGASLGRGLFIRGNHGRNDATNGAPRTRIAQPRFKVPITPPVGVINRASLKLFNALYWRKTLTVRKSATVDWDPFFYPLDGIGGWNRLYGPRGLVQHQSVLPYGTARDAVRELIERTHAARSGSFLTVLKAFGDHPSAGLLSFARPGVTLTLDFPNAGTRSLALLAELDRVTIEAGGAVNPYKDARMSAETFEASFPNWRDMLHWVDPAMSSSFWRRVTAPGTEVVAPLNQHCA